MTVLYLGSQHTYKNVDHDFYLKNFATFSSIITLASHASLPKEKSNLEITFYNNLKLQLTLTFLGYMEIGQEKIQVQVWQNLLKMLSNVLIILILRDLWTIQIFWFLLKKGPKHSFYRKLV